ncbi:Telomerase reverse transcriptase [Colletotrichum siamense]|uniref:Telomerase reverse transcriptase n=1 Tax=Colletotrichum siamense TaxID=690259 RepID=UPI001872D8AF|nr:Telomerase reverse transcriptase [Colletotrichum siamense]KAF5516403.1 Telomerase reverse transcriptase [Colletotrichum siamense]
MAPKRKAEPQQQPVEGRSGSKRLKADRAQNAVRQSVLLQYYDNVQNLREYLLSRLPSSSRLRRKKIASIGLSRTSLAKEALPAEADLSKLLDSTLIVNFVIWQLFSSNQSGGWPRHLLCDGFRRYAQNAGNPREPRNGDWPSGLYRVHPNHFVQTLKASPWPQLLMLLGKSGEQIMIDLLIDTAIFLPAQAGVGNMYQLSGTPMFAADTARWEPAAAQKPAKDSNLESERLPSELPFMRNRMLYARAALTGRGTVHYGFRHIHVLSRCPRVTDSAQADPDQKTRLDQSNEQNTLKVMMYIFPRQFGLHNVFTSKVDHLKTAQKLPDYTLREEEINSLFKDQKIRTPKRLRGDVKRLVEHLQLLHGRCAYAELLRHHCPSAIDGTTRKSAHKKPAKPSGTQLSLTYTQATAPASRSAITTKHRHKARQQAPSIPTIKFDAVTDLATPAPHVSAFCRAVLARLIPDAFWGSGPDQAHNRDLVFKRVDHFVGLRRFESMSLEEVTDGIKVTAMDWLAPPKLKGMKASQSDMKKRLEILHEFLYYVFDSILIPLLRSNFYITESSSHRYRLFFFRHDVWRYVAEPAMATLRANMLEEVSLGDANRILASRRLGFSRIRLLPKGKTMRPITNLRRRAAAQGRNALGPSINSVLGPVHSMLRLETERNPSKLGSSMFSVGDIYTRLRSFSASFGEDSPTFYFAKVDVQSAFDTIPQDAVVRLMGGVPSQAQYVIKKHLEVKAGLVDPRLQRRPASKLTRRWHSLASTRDDPAGFAQVVQERLGPKRKNAVFVGNISRKEHATKYLMELMESHIQHNLVKVGKKYYRQKKGIPQGSVLSSALCNYFYADLEAERLSFLRGKDCLLLRLIDDFLLISTSQRKARKFVKVMHGGVPEYGVAVNPNKTLVNFDLELGGVKVSRALKASPFPYCGLSIDCKTLDIIRDHDTAKGAAISNALTVDYGVKPGQNFQRRVLNAFKIQSHLMFYDTRHNTLETVFSNLHKAFTETTEKMLAYWRCLPAAKRPRSRMLTQTINRIIDVAFVLLTGKARKEKHPDYSCAMEKTHVTWLALDAVRKALLKRQANFSPVLGWIDAELGRLDTAKTARVKKYIK